MWTHSFVTQHTGPVKSQCVYTVTNSSTSDFSAPAIEQLHYDVFSAYLTNTTSPVNRNDEVTITPLSFPCYFFIYFLSLSSILSPYSLSFFIFCCILSSLISPSSSLSNLSVFPAPLSTLLPTTSTLPPRSQRHPPAGHHSNAGLPTGHPPRPSP